MFTKVVLLALAASVRCFNKEVDEKFRHLPHDEFVKYFNSQNFSYQITHYDGIDKKAVSCATLNHLIPIPVKSTQKYNWNDYVPVEFDGRVRWKHCFQYPLDQGECGACWAVTTATVASIRKCIQWTQISGGHDSSRDAPEFSYSRQALSPLDLVCCKGCYTESFCGEGSAEKAALFWMSSGLVSNFCKPYSGQNNTSACKEACVNDTIYYNPDKYFGNSVSYLLQDDHEIRREIFYKGPVIANFVLLEDFRDYKDGVYEHTHGKLLGFHSVPVIGYGVENGVPYWLAVNTWGDAWGQQNTFKVKRFAEFLYFETEMLSLTPRMF